MDKRKIIIPTLLVILILSSVLGAEARGCFTKETKIATPEGYKTIDSIKQGDLILSTQNGALVQNKVAAVYEMTEEGYYILTTKTTKVNITGEHLISVGNGLFKRVADLKQGEDIEVLSGNIIQKEQVTSITLISEETRVYNLLAEDRNDFFANNILVHNKGCFLPDTPILLSDGTQKEISRIKKGDEVVSFDYDGKTINTEVKEIYAAEADSYFEIRTENHFVKATGEHPFYIGDGIFKTAEYLKEGETIYVYDNGLIPEKIISKKEIEGKTKVYNLQTDYPNTFFANFIAVHNKGCFLADTPILKADGSWENISSIKKGDVLQAFTPQEQIVNATVEDIYTADSDSYFDIRTGNYFVRVTKEHPFYIGEGSFKTAEYLKVDDEIYVLNGSSLAKEKIISIQKILENHTVYNLKTDYPNTFFANFIAVHNKGGCFAAGTKISTPLGLKSIEELKEGDVVYSLNQKSMIEQTKVVKTYQKTDQVVLLKTANNEVRTTFEHPFMTDSGTFKKVSELRIGDKIYVLRQGTITTEAIKEIKPLTEETVYNLEVGDPHTFIADNFIVHNKGGGGGFSGGGGSGSFASGNWTDSHGLTATAYNDLFWWVIIILFLVISSFFKKNDGDDNEDLDFCFEHSTIELKAAKTDKVLDYLKTRDPSMWDKEPLTKRVADTFTKLQVCWEKREYSPMQPLLMPNLYKDHVNQLNSMIRSHEIDVLDDMKIDNIWIVQARFYNNRSMQEFTALIEATCTDHYIDDRTKKYIRGDEEPATFQEFWVFQRKNDKWLLRQIDQSRESDALREDNFVEDLTPYQLTTLYGDLAKRGAKEKAPWLEDKVKGKSDKIHRMLNFLSKTDRNWEEETIKEITRKTFVEMLVAFEKLDTSNLNDLLIPETLEEYKATISDMKKRGLTIEYRNSCVRKVDIILVRNYPGKDKDEFTARIAAHAQKIQMKNGHIESADPYEIPFEEYWTFRKYQGQWRLAEVQPPSIGKDMINQENIDQESSKEMIDWYYKQDRAV